MQRFSGTVFWSNCVVKKKSKFNAEKDVKIISVRSMPSRRQFLNKNNISSEKHKKSETQVEEFAPIEITPTKVRIRSF